MNGQCFYYKRIAGLAIGLLAVMHCVLRAEAPAPKVTFGAPYTVECRDVTPKSEGDGPVADRRIIEATFRFSVNVKGDASRIRDVFFRINSMGDSDGNAALRLHRFLPTESLIPSPDGSFEVTTSEESGSTSNTETTGRARIIAVTPVGQGAGAVDSEGSVKSDKREASKIGKTKKEKYEKKTAAVIRGTDDRERGVYFKLNQHTQVPIEGVKEFRVQFVAAPNWRGDWVEIRCEANSSDGKSLGVRCLAVGMYLIGKAGPEYSAKMSAEKLVDTQTKIDEARASSVPVSKKIMQEHRAALREMKSHAR